MERNAALQRALHDAKVFKVQTTILIKWNLLSYKRIFDINTPKVTQKMAGYLAHQVRTFAQAKQLCEMETEGLAIFSCCAGVVNARAPFEMGRLQHELTQCLRPLQLTEELRRFAMAPILPPAVQIPFPPGLFSL